MKLEQPLFNDSPQQKRTYRQKCVHFALGIVTTLFCLLPTTSMAEEKMCTDLKKVNNLDELLYQMYSNLDSDCLFTMPLAELEEAWGTKILDRNNLKPGQRLFELRRSVDFDGKPYHSEADAFYVEAYREGNRTTNFTIFMTEAYEKAHITLFPEGNFPRMLPDPISRALMPLPNPSIDPDGPPRYPQNPGKYNGRYVYFWVNTAKTHMIVITPGQTNAVGGIRVHDEIPSGFLKYITE